MDYNITGRQVLLFMAGSTYGTNFKIMTWGESHGVALGVVIDGCPAGLFLSEADIQPYLNRRKSGLSDMATPRKEDDKVEILSGIFDGKTTGAPISMMIKNTNQRPLDYQAIADYYRPGHADFTYDTKYGFRDYRGGGRSSGRETIGRVAAGAVAAKILSEIGIICTASVKAMGIIDKKDDSVGGVIECKISGVPAGIGEPVFDKLDAALAHAMMSIGAVKAVEIGDGIGAATAYGSENNDSFESIAGKIVKQTNHSGGILGGLSDGSEIILRVHFKPTPSIAATQQTVDRSGQSVSINIKGRHDPVIVPRAVVVVECMAALTILDAMMINTTSKLENLIRFYHPTASDEK